ncbi:hypothetical protein J7481_19630 [Labrenzia sp. R4_2]|uniref:hypothetical protein n=1 Tax=Labrenzia sp. R4_2 TaxID=2821107 RepID=UPI001ADA5FC0|nr:hypothetical protein [Labrenzia sp. R4_2]MBO9421728.1 hypothetical protein [Labrenzia sp. R4_2]
MSVFEHFIAQPSSAPVPDEQDRIAITFSMPDTVNEDGTKSLHWRWPVLVVSDMCGEPEKFAQTVSEILNENIDRFVGGS